MGKSMRKGEKVTLRRSYGSKPSKSKRKKKATVNSGRDDDSDDSGSEELSAMMKGIVEDVKKLELEEGSISDESDDETQPSREARMTRNSIAMMKSKAKSTDHKLLSGEDFTINDVIARIEDDDVDLTALTIRQTGQNIKDVVVPHGEDGADNDDDVAMSEAIILVLPAHLTNNKLLELSSALSMNQSLLTLDLRGNSITDDSCTSICTALKSNHKVQNLNLAQNKITSKGVPSITSLISKCLVRLNLSKNAIGDAGVQNLAGGIAATKTLKEIHLSDCKMRSSGASFLASAFAVNKSLQTINLQGNNNCGTGNSSKRLAFALMRSQRLRHLYVRVSSSSQPATLQSLDRINAVKHLNAPGRARGDAKPHPLEVALKVRDPNSSLEKQLAKLRATLLVIEAAMPEGAVRSEGKKASWIPSIAAQWRKNVEVADGPSALMRCVICLECALDSEWLREASLKIIANNPTHSKALQAANLSSVAIRIYLLDRGIKFGAKMGSDQKIFKRGYF